VRMNTMKNKPRAIDTFNPTMLYCYSTRTRMMLVYTTHGPHVVIDTVLLNTIQNCSIFVSAIFHHLQLTCKHVEGYLDVRKLSFHLQFPSLLLLLMHDYLFQDMPLRYHHLQLLFLQPVLHRFPSVDLPLKHQMHVQRPYHSFTTSSSCTSTNPFSFISRSNPLSSNVFTMTPSTYPSSIITTPAPLPPAKAPLNISVPYYCQCYKPRYLTTNTIPPHSKTPGFATFRCI